MENIYRNNQGSYDPEHRWLAERAFMMEFYRQRSQWLALTVFLFCLALLIYLIVPRSPSVTPSALNSPQVESIYREVDLLRRQLNTLITGAIEQKLDRIETNLTGGMIKEGDLKMLKELQQDLKLLKNNTSLTVPQLNRAQRKYQAQQPPSLGNASAADGDQLLQQIVALKKWLSLSIGLCFLLLIGFGVLCLRNLYRIRTLEARWSIAPAIPGERDDDRS